MNANRLSRREAIQWVLAASASVSFLSTQSFGADAAAVGAAQPYGTDPLLTKIYRPGELWPLTLSESQRQTVTALCDLIIPEDEKSPAASKVGLPDFIDEWISAPYAHCQTDRLILLDGLAWLDSESERRFQKSFASLTLAEQTQIADEIAWLPRAKPQHEKAARFFSVFRDLTLAGFYTTPQGMRDLGYIGNMPQVKFNGPPPEVLKRLDLA